ncbi:Arrestin domain-containing protein 4 [Cladochytrium tenue]|nr:Arrestin domain-containing protein 4 [Cladochytrium tenue]
MEPDTHPPSPSRSPRPASILSNATAAPVAITVWPRLHRLTPMTHSVSSSPSTSAPTSPRLSPSASPAPHTFGDFVGSTREIRLPPSSVYTRDDDDDDDADTLNGHDDHIRRLGGEGHDTLVIEAPPVHLLNLISLNQKGRRNVIDYRVELLGNRTVFLPGQYVEGVISFHVLAPVEVYNLNVTLKGVVITSVFKAKPGREVNIDENSITAGSATLIFKESEALLGNRVGHTHLLMPGPHQYLFRCRLPSRRLPASFEGIYGRIEYRLDASLNLRGCLPRFASVKLTVPSTVNAANPAFDLGKEMVGSVNDRSWGRKTGRIEVSLRITRSAFNPEEAIPVHLEIRNHSASKIVVEEISLRQTCRYITLNEVKGPCAERVYHVPASALEIPSDARIVRRRLNIRIPPTTTFSPDIETSLIRVTHSVAIKVSAAQRVGELPRFSWMKSSKQQSCSVVVELPFVIAGFPSSAGSRTSVDTLPRYLEIQEAGERPSVDVPGPDPANPGSEQSVDAVLNIADFEWDDEDLTSILPSNDGPNASGAAQDEQEADYYDLRYGSSDDPHGGLPSSKIILLSPAAA